MLLDAWKVFMAKSLAKQSRTFRKTFHSIKGISGKTVNEQQKRHAQWSRLYTPGRDTKRAFPKSIVAKKKSIAMHISVTQVFLKAMV